jgi:alkanesulfonate monooxygenase SsuD/methylene tetrahydromethanopterin reductase-like flavin-dependent oxidoreductase (luciferase family)
MFTQGQSSFAGEHFQIDGAYNNPQPIRGDIPILIGGSGERKTLRLVAKYGDGCNLFGGPEQVQHLLGVLEQHCADVGRDSSQITKTAMGRVLIGATHEAAQAKAQAARASGVSEEALASIIIGDPDTVGERVQAVKDIGLEGYTLSMPDSYDLEAVDLVGRTLAPIFAP